MKGTKGNPYIPIVLASLSLLLSACGIIGLPAPSRVFFVDPVGGSMDNDGSRERPWSSIQQVVDTKLQTFRYAAHPWSGDNPSAARNPGAPVSGGDAIVLLPGYHGPLLIQEAYNRREIVLRAEAGAVLSSVHVVSASRWTLSGLTVDGSSDGQTSAADTLLFIESHTWLGPCHDILVTGCRLSGVADSRAWTAADWDAKAPSAIAAYGDDIVIKGNSCLNVNFGISVVGDRCLVDSNTVSWFCGDGMRGLGDDDVFQYNTVENALNVNGNHADGFQSWAVGDDPSERMTLRGNRIIQWEGSVRPALSVYLQGIGLYDGPYVDWTIESNLIVTDMYHGISLYGGIDCRILNNTVVDEEAGNATAPWIAVFDKKDGTPSSDCLVRNNTAPSFLLGRGSSADHNRAIGPERYAEFFVDPAALDFRPNYGSSLVDAGNPDDAPVTDILGKARPRGTRIDIGAYER
jgi:hypothetical protein